MLDTGDGVLSVQEFFDGIGCMEGPACAKDLLHTNKTADFIVKLICQQNQELREDIDELLRLTPGANIRARKGSLRHRARRGQSSDSIFHTNNTNANSEMAGVSPNSAAMKANSFNSSAMRANSFRRTEQVALGDIMQRLDQFAGMLHESRQECKEGLAVCSTSLEACNQRIGSLSNDVSELKSNLHNGSPFPPQPCLEHQHATTSHWRSHLRLEHGQLPLGPLLPPSV